MCYDGALRGKGLPFLMPKTMPSCGYVFSAIALDLNLGEEHGLDLARDIRIMLTGKGDAVDRVVGLELG
jgi:DNA-binding response OmpR family regulator